MYTRHTSCTPQNDSVIHSTRFSDGAGQDIRSTVIRFPSMQPPVSTHVSQTLHARDLPQLECICMRMRVYVHRRRLCHPESLSYIVLYACCCPQSRTSPSSSSSKPLLQPTLSYYPHAAHTLADTHYRYTVHSVPLCATNIASKSIPLPQWQPPATRQASHRP